MSKSAMSSIIGVVLILAFFGVIMTVLPGALRPKPPIEVNVSLSPTTIKENEIAKLTLSLKNSDLKTHQIRIVFDTNPRILVYAGTEQLLRDYTFSLTLEASKPSDERVFTMTGVLEERVSSSDYPVTLKIYVDGNELAKTWDDAVLTVKK
jgi:uncharacterized protein (DUF58 family)